MFYLNELLVLILKECLSAYMHVYDGIIYIFCLFSSQHHLSSYSYSVCSVSHVLSHPQPSTLTPQLSSQKLL